MLDFSILREANPVERLTRKAQPILSLILIITTVFGFMLLVVGVIAMYRAVTGNVELSFFGQSLKATNIGLSSIFIGAVLVTVLIRRILKSLDASIAADAENSAKDTVAPKSQKKDIVRRDDSVLPFYYMDGKHDETWQRTLSQTPEDQASSLLHRYVNYPRYDIAAETAMKLEKMPPTDIPEKALFFSVEKMFRRPAFYGHGERDWAYALYAVVATRIVWEQQVMPRLRSVRRTTGAAITRKLMDLEDFHAKVLGVSPEELTRCTSEHLWHKVVFEYFLPIKRPFAETSYNIEKRRNEILKELAELILRVGLDLPDLGTCDIMAPRGGE